MKNDSLSDLVVKMSLDQVQYFLKKQYFCGDDDPLIGSTLGDLYIMIGSKILSEKNQEEIEKYIREIDKNIGFKSELGKISTILYVADILHQTMNNPKIFNTKAKFISFDQYLKKFPIIDSCLKISMGNEYLRITDDKKLIGKKISDLFIESFILYLQKYTSLEVVHMKTYAQLSQRIANIVSRDFIVNMRENVEDSTYTPIAMRMEGIRKPNLHSRNQMDITSWLGDAEDYKIDLYFIHQTGDFETTNLPCILSFGFKTLESIAEKIFIGGIKKAKKIEFVKVENTKRQERRQLLSVKGNFNEKLGGDKAFLELLKTVKVFDTFRFNYVFRNMDRVNEYSQIIKSYVPPNDKIDTENPENSIHYFENEYEKPDFTGSYRAIKGYPMCPFGTGELFAVHIQSIFDYLKSIYGPDSHLNYNRRKIWQQFTRQQTKMIEDMSSDMIRVYSKYHSV